jgi:hypothetical protein
LRTVFGPVHLDAAKGHRRLASWTVLPLGSIDREYHLPRIDFGQTLLFSPRDGLAKAKKRTVSASRTSSRSRRPQ